VASSLIICTVQFYLEALLHAFSRIRMSYKRDIPASAVVWDSLLTHTISFLALHFDDRAIVNPDLHEAMLGNMSQLIKRKVWMGVFENNKAARQRLVRSPLPASLYLRSPSPSVCLYLVCLSVPLFLAVSLVDCLS
jgi:hypothetical protein